MRGSKALELRWGFTGRKESHKVRFYFSVVIGRGRRGRGTVSSSPIFWVVCSSTMTSLEPSEIWLVQVEEIMWLIDSVAEEMANYSLLLFSPR